LNANLTHIREDPSSYRCDPFKKRWICIFFCLINTRQRNTQQTY
jgi:hypothetical protein